MRNRAPLLNPAGMQLRWERRLFGEALQSGRNRPLGIHPESGHPDGRHVASLAINTPARVSNAGCATAGLKPGPAFECRSTPKLSGGGGGTSGPAAVVRSRGLKRSGPAPAQAAPPATAVRAGAARALCRHPPRHAMRRLLVITLAGGGSAGGGSGSSSSSSSGGGRTAATGAKADVLRVRCCSDADCCRYWQLHREPLPLRRDRRVSAVSSSPVRTAPQQLPPQTRTWTTANVCGRTYGRTARVQTRLGGRAGTAPCNPPLRPTWPCPWTCATRPQAAVGIDLGTTTSAVAVVGPDGR